MKTHFQKTVLTIIVLFGMQQTFAQAPQLTNESSKKIHILEDCFNNEDKLIDKVTIITENEKAKIYYQQNLGDNNYTPLIKIDTFITPKNDVISLISYNSTTGNKDIIIGERNDHNPTKLDLSRSTIITIGSISNQLFNITKL